MGEVIREPRQLTRDFEDRVLGGVASGVGCHLGVDPLTVRLAFVALSLLGGFGLVVYAALWVLLPVGGDDADVASSPGLESATRQGLRTGHRPTRHSDLSVAVSLVVVALGGVVLLQNAGLGISGRVFWPVAVAGAGVALLWRQSDRVGRSQWLLAGTGWTAALRVVLGVVLIAAAVWLSLFTAGVSGALDDVLGAILLAVGGIALVTGPWLLRLRHALTRERRERVRSQERADVAAHLHDSVLQTLALIQRQAGDAQTVAQLARTQERELRSWLFDAADPSGTTFRAALQHVAAEVEDTHRVPVELVVVGDAPTDDGLAALVAASREAMVNAAKHSAAPRIDVFAEVEAMRAEVGVRDRGTGFQLVDVAPDRHGVRKSIIERMQRHGGNAAVRSSAGEGTEIRMWVSRMPQQEDDR